MATRRKSGKGGGRSQGGGALYGVLIGLLIGLAVAAVVAFYVTRAPMPFVDRATREPDQGKPTDLSRAPDPNLGLYGRDGAAGTPSTGPTATPPAPLPGQKPPAKPMDDLGALIATLPSSDSKPPAPPDLPVPVPDAPPAKPQQGASAGNGTAAANGSYFLQAGAYRVLEDAESLRARILLLGLPVSVQRAEVNGMPINRVRVGPFARLDDMNRARGRLGENKIESTVVRQ